MTCQQKTCLYQHTQGSDPGCSLPLCQLQPLSGAHSPCQETTRRTKAEPTGLNTLACRCRPTAGQQSSCDKQVPPRSQQPQHAEREHAAEVTALRLRLHKRICVAQLKLMLNALCGLLCNADTGVVAFEQSCSAGVILLYLAHQQP